MPDFFAPTALLVHAAALTQVYAFTCRDQVRLRIFLLIGNALYIAYYLLHPETPLWDAMAWSSVMIVSNAIVIGQIFKDRRMTDLSAEDAALFSAMGCLTPGQFRRMMKVSTKHDAVEEQVLIEHDTPSTGLYFLMSGNVRIDVSGKVIENAAPRFLGEVSILLNSNTNGQVTALPGARWLKIPKDFIDGLSDRDSEMHMNLTRGMSADLASKLRAG